MERACLDRLCHLFVRYLPYNPCHPAVRCRPCAPGHRFGLHPPFVPAVLAALARLLVRPVQAVPVLPVLALLPVLPVPLALAKTGNRHIATSPRLNRYQYTVPFSFSSPLRFC